MIIYTYDNTYKKSGDRWQSGANYSLAKAVETALTHIVETRKKEGREPGSVLLLGRFGFEGISWKKRDYLNMYVAEISKKVYVIRN